jgi:hypothetical protein
MLELHAQLRMQQARNGGSKTVQQPASNDGVAVALTIGRELHDQYDELARRCPWWVPDWAGDRDTILADADNARTTMNNLIQQTDTKGTT